MQADLAWEDKPASRGRIERLLEGAGVGQGDLVVLPEMCETGFSMNVDVTADTTGESAAWLASLAERQRAYVVGGITAPPSGTSEKARNRALVFDPHGREVARYDKLHPFSFGKEAERFEGGDRVCAFEWPIGAEKAVVSPLICYDLRFPEAFRACRGLGAEVFVVIANWPAARAEHWKALLRARAIENQAVVVGVNRAGDDPFLAYSGDSVAFDEQGTTLADAGPGAQALRVEIDLKSVRAWREAFRAWTDARSELLPRVGDSGELRG